MWLGVWTPHSPHTWFHIFTMLLNLVPCFLAHELLVAPFSKHEAWWNTSKFVGRTINFYRYVRVSRCITHWSKWYSIATTHSSIGDPVLESNFVGITKWDPRQGFYTYVRGWLSTLNLNLESQGIDRTTWILLPNFLSCVN